MVLTRAQGRMAILCLQRRLPLELAALVMSFLKPTLTTIGRELDLLSVWSPDGSYSTVPLPDVLAKPENAMRMEHVLQVFKEQYDNHSFHLLRANTYEAHVFGRCKLAWLLFELKALLQARQQEIRRYLNVHFIMLRQHVYPFLKLPVMNPISYASAMHNEVLYDVVEHLEVLPEVEYIWQLWFRCEPETYTASREEHSYEHSLTWLVALNIVQEFQYFPVDKTPCEHPFSGSREDCYLCEDINYR